MNGGSDGRRNTGLEGYSQESRILEFFSGVGSSAARPVGASREVLPQQQIARGSGARTAITPPQELLEVEKAKVSRVFCSSSWALAEPVAGLALAERFTERTRMFRACAMCSRRGST